MFKKYSILLGLSIGTCFLILATFYYPGGSYSNISATGYSWTDNYISNLLSPLAVNGMANRARPFAIIGILLLTVTFGYFFVKFSGSVRIRSAACIIKYLGLLATFLGFVTVIPRMHDIMVMASSILTLLIFFYITVIILKSKLTILKVMSVFFLLTFYFGAYMYFTRSFLDYMPIVQKIIFVMKITWVISIEYSSTREDYCHIIS